jgi:hypothetical protein
MVTFLDYSDRLTYLEVLYYLTFGFVENTIGFESMNSTTCLKILKAYYNNATTELPRYFSGSYYKEVSLTTSYFFRNVDPLTKSCLWMIDETDDAFFDYGFSLEDTQRIIFNFIYHFGAIYDRQYEINFIFKYDMYKVLEAP